MTLSSLCPAHVFRLMFLHIQVCMLNIVRLLPCQILMWLSQPLCEQKLYFKSEVNFKTQLNPIESVGGPGQTQLRVDVATLIREVSKL